MQESLLVHFCGLSASLEDAEDAMPDLKEELKKIEASDGISRELSDEVMA